MLAFKLAEKTSCLLRCLVNFGIDCWLFIREKSTPVNQNPKKTNWSIFLFWSKSQYFLLVQKPIIKHFFDCLTNQQIKT